MQVFAPSFDFIPGDLTPLDRQQSVAVLFDTHWDVAALQQHNAEESSISPAELEKAVQAARDAFTATYGEAAGQKAATVPPDRKKEVED